MSDQSSAKLRRESRMKAAKASVVGSLTVMILASACAAPWSPPTPAQILLKPSQSGEKDGHFNLKGHFTSGAFSADVTGDGTMVLKPRWALSMRVQGSIGAIPFAVQLIEVDNKSYSRVGTEKWAESESKSQPASNLSSAKNPKLVAEEDLPQGKTWHLQATDSSSNQSFDAWIRESDGYLVKYSGSTDTGSLTIDFDKFNTGATIEPPPARDIKPPSRNLTGKVGDRLSLTGVAVTVVSADLNAKPGNPYIRPKTANRFVAVQVLYENTGTDAVNYNPFDWSLRDASGFSYDQTFAGIGPELHSGTLNPGDKARGFIAYEVPTSATGLMLKLKQGDDSATVMLG